MSRTQTEIVEHAATPAAAPSIPADPATLRALSAAEVDALLPHLRRSLLDIVAASGGHVGPNLGVLELTVALHRVFDSPRDPIVFDTGHQAYVHKMLTGRPDLAGLRTEGGISGYPSRSESEHDLVENSHASGSLAWALGLGMAFSADAAALSDGSRSRTSVAVIGDGALTGGVGLEALNLAVDHPHARTVFVLNDNTRSYAPTIGGLARCLSELRSGTAAANPFEVLGYRYIGPVDGHDVHALEAALTQARDAAGQGAVPLVHAVTAKGRGLLAAELHEVDLWHAHGPFDITTAQSTPDPVPTGPGATWTDRFAATVLGIADQRDDMVALSAAMIDPVGLTPMQQAHPARVLDTGIAEQVTLDIAAGLANAGQRPLVALYSTFLTRAIDQLLMDIGLHSEPVTITLDRAGVTGDDGASHHGIWDLALAAQVPGLEVCAPRDGQRLEDALRRRLGGDEAPTGPGLIRFPKGSVGPDVAAAASVPAGDVLFASSDAALACATGEALDAEAPTLIITIGSLAGRAVAAAKTLAATGAEVLVIDPVIALPLAGPLLDLCARASAVVTIEDGVRERGIGAALRFALADRGVQVPSAVLGVDQAFIDHAKRDAILSREGLDAEAIAEAAARLR
ncbi:1-deoxy-D-xylulose-5-phosphate synthase [Helcobacillus sp. ACRRO]|uniref:1-deoxy-D-xylulose-5-phosphate synthase n=1 Tax=Helcobacillus TaxID=1161125 RepID=UPI001EF62C0C|nr:MULTISPECIES: 1-deoxy-D-xylulose-5-phosphate synthase [Helcobacillus]MCG7426474.1 1-deoxy-D-xylulose-5-phosphate synthase [Helcobacillus sp. ACRRO]MDK7741015.1 1-deoxy-D-xylulose-5-phosphate synthase [Helcobacillus massiliensis]